MRPAPWIVLFLGWAAPAAAHNFAFTDVHLTLTRDGRFQADVKCDLDALALGVDSSADSAALAAQIAGLSPPEREALEQGLVDLLKRRLRVRFDGTPAPFEVGLPDRGRAPSPGVAPSALGLLARIEGTVPAGAQAVEFFASRGFPPVKLVVTKEAAGASVTEVLEQGGTSRPVPLTAPAPEPSRWEVARRFLSLGFAHIVPQGLDHVLFVLGLVLLSPRLMPLLAQISAFTTAHTVTLALSTYGLVRLPSRVVEPLIALSIVYVAVENVVRKHLRPSRIALVFAFGLLHGLGFAGALAQMGLPAGERVTALLAFNGGVELGQLAVIVIAQAFLAAAVTLGVPRARMVRPLSLLIAAVGLYWAGARLSA